MGPDAAGMLHFASVRHNLIPRKCGIDVSMMVLYREYGTYFKVMWLHAAKFSAQLFSGVPIWNVPRIQFLAMKDSAVKFTDWISQANVFDFRHPQNVLS